MLRDGDELSPDRDPFLKGFLEEERRRVGGAAEDRKEELRLFIDVRESELVDVNPNPPMDRDGRREDSGRG